MVREVDQFDTAIKIVTPENIAFEYRVAGPFRRLPAYLLDVAIQGATMFVVSLAVMLLFGLAGMPFFGSGMVMVFWFVVAWFYGGVFETFWNGQTPGKWAMGIRVVSVEGQPITGLQAVLRNVLRVLDGQPGMTFLLGPFTYQVGLLAAFSNDRFQRLGDLVSGTMVVVEERQWFQGLVRMDDPEVAQMAGRVPASFLPSRSLCEALAAYVQRRRSFSWPRLMEIARHLGEPLRAKFNLPPNTNLDLLLCGLYHRAFITDRQSELAAEALPVVDVLPAYSQHATPAEAMSQAVAQSEGQWRARP